MRARYPVIAATPRGRLPPARSCIVIKSLRSESSKSDHERPREPQMLSGFSPRRPDSSLSARARFGLECPGPQGTRRALARVCDFARAGPAGKEWPPVQGMERVVRRLWGHDSVRKGGDRALPAPPLCLTPPLSAASARGGPYTRS